MKAPGIQEDILSRQTGGGVVVRNTLGFKTRGAKLFLYAFRLHSMANGAQRDAGGPHSAT